MAVGLLTACASRGPADSAIVESAAPVAPATYELGPGDTLRIVVFGEETLTGEYLVNQQGSIDFPLIGSVPAQGASTETLARTIVSRLNEGFVRDANVTVGVARYRPFFILGEVQTPGSYPFSANLTVMSAVATAGGFSYRANTRRVFIRHAGDDVERVYPLTSATSVLPGDTVRIGERYF